MELYRYDNQSGHTSVRLQVFVVVRETEKSLWIIPKVRPGYTEDKPKRIGKNGLRPFASESKEGALTEFIKRRERQIFILRHRLNIAEIVRNKGMKMLKDIGGIQNGYEISQKGLG